MNRPRPKKRFRRRVALPALVLILAGAAVVLWWAPWHSAGSDVPSKQESSDTGATDKVPEPIDELPFDKSEYSVNKASSLWAVVNKGRALPSGYVPTDLVSPQMLLRLSPSVSSMYLRKDAAEALETMAAAAKADDIHLMLASGYRSYSNQQSVYSGYVEQHGRAQTDTFSARPGHSEHQTGLAADIEPSTRKCELEVCFAETPEGRWVAKNAHRYGFIIRYPQSREHLTGYDYEPWHLRYVGTDLARQIYQTAQTLEQFFGMPSFSTYPDSPFTLASDT